MKLQPIDTAPFGVEVMVFGDSGYCDPHGTFFVNAYRERDWHQGEWNDPTGDRLSDQGWKPTHWCPIPTIELTDGQGECACKGFFKPHWCPVHGK